MNNLGKRMHSIQAYLFKKSKMKQDIEDSDLFKVSELGCLAVALFCEMEVLRLTNNPANKRKVFKFPPACVLNPSQKNVFPVWYRTLTRKLEKLKLQFATLMEDHSSQILKFNDRIGLKCGIRIPGLHFFNKSQRFSKFQKGELKVYKVSSFLKKDIQYGEDFLGQCSRHTLWMSLGSLISEQAFKSKEGKKVVTKVGDISMVPNKNLLIAEAKDMQEVGPSVRGDKSPALSPHMIQTVDRLHEKHPVDVQYSCKGGSSQTLRGNVSNSVGAPVSVNDSYGMDETSLSQTQAPNMEPKNTYRQMVQANKEIPDCHKNNPGFMTDSFHYLNERIEGWKSDQKYIRKRLFFLGDKLAKENTEEGFITVCTEVAKHSNTIESISQQFETERAAYSKTPYKQGKLQFSPSILTDIGPVAANHLVEKMNQFELNLKLLHKAYKKVFFTNLKAIEAFNSSEAAKLNGRLILPTKLYVLRYNHMKTVSDGMSDANMRATIEEGGHHQWSSSGYDEQHRIAPASHLRVPHQQFYSEGLNRQPCQDGGAGSGYQSYHLESRETFSPAKSHLKAGLLPLPDHYKANTKNAFQKLGKKMKTRKGGGSSTISNAEFPKAAVNDFQHIGPHIKMDTGKICEENDPGFMTDTFKYINDMIEGWKKDHKSIRKSLFLLSDKLAKNQKEEGRIKVFMEVAKQGKIIESIGQQFEANRAAYIDTLLKNVRFQFSPSVLADIGSVAANHLVEKMNQFELDLRLLHQSFTKIFFTNLKAIEAFNCSEAAQHNGQVVLPTKLDKIRNSQMKTGSDGMSGANMRATFEVGGHHQWSSSGYGEQHRIAPASHLRVPHQHFYSEGLNKQPCQDGGAGSGYQSYHLESSETVPTYNKDVTRHKQFWQSTNALAAGSEINKEVDSFLPSPPLPPFMFPRSDEHCSQLKRREGCSNTSHHAPFDAISSDHSSFERSIPKKWVQQDDYNTRSFYHEHNFKQPHFENNINPQTENGWQSGYWYENDAYSSYTPFQYESLQAPRTSGNENVTSTNNQFDGNLFVTPHSASANFRTHKDVSKPETMNRSNLSTQWSSHFNKVSPSYAETAVSDFGVSSQSGLNFSFQSHQAAKDQDMMHRSFSFQNSSYKSSHVNPDFQMPPETHLNNKDTALPSDRNAYFLPRSNGFEENMNLMSNSFPPTPDDSRHGHNASPEALLQSPDPADGLQVDCHCNCRGKLLQGIPSMPQHHQNLCFKALHWLKLSLLKKDVEKVMQMQTQSCTRFDKFSKDSHRKAVNIFLDINATLPHLAALMKQLRKNHEQQGFPDDELQRIGETEFEGISLEVVEKALQKLYMEHCRLYKERKLVILKFHHHAEKFISIRNDVYGFGEMPNTFDMPIKNSKKKKGTLTNLGVFSSKDKTSKEKLRYYQSLLDIQKKVASVRKEIQTRKKILHEKGVAFVTSDQSVSTAVKKYVSVLVNSKKHMIRLEVYREMYGNYIPRYVQSFLKGPKCGKKTIENHIKNYEFILKLINWGAKELKEYVQNLSPNVQRLVNNLEFEIFSDC
ncbi:hypothetical protein EGW08_010088 [Elysia chlorotica]|uniref:Uncharacterized protein n=1 Tax=Elysia chlorotica TaxID=188477 RepID=A0A433TKS2_ELYCH|nr:hypothetical protein EGW08_010088 [Elysia chlorotica]